MDDGASKGGIVLLHGLNRRSGSMGRLAAAARSEGYATCSPGYPGRHLPLAALVAHIAPTIAAFESSFAGPLNIVTHSLGGLVARALILAKRPARLGRVVMLAPPNAGSEVADLLYRARLNRPFLGPVGVQLCTGRLAQDERLLGAIDFDCGIIAGDRPIDPVLPRLIFRRSNDGKVAVAATKVRGMADHVVLPVSHPLMMYDRRVIAQAMTFLRHGRFKS